MQVITTTQLRTNATQLVQALGQGKTVKLIHRSKIIGDVAPLASDELVQRRKVSIPFSKAVEIAQKEFFKQGKLLPQGDKELMKAYYNQLLEKYGKNIS